MAKRTELNDQFSAQDDQGRTHTIYVYTEFETARSFGDKVDELRGMSELRTASGAHVNRLEKGKYEVVDTGAVLTSTAPNAP